MILYLTSSYVLAIVTGRIPNKDCTIPTRSTNHPVSAIIIIIVIIDYILPFVRTFGTTLGIVSTAAATAAAKVRSRI